VSASYWFDKARVLERVQMGLEDGIDEAADRIAADARQRAPIRKVFKEKRGFRRKIREATSQETVVRQRLTNEYYRAQAAYGVVDRLGRTARQKRSLSLMKYKAIMRPSRKSANAWANSREDRQLGVVRRGTFRGYSGNRRIWTRSGAGVEPGEPLRAKLTARGLYELRTGRGVFQSATGEVQAGGALKASIDTRPVHETAAGVETEVVAAIRYAKYVEFPTVHNRAQPFLLPALKDEQRTFVRDVAASIRRSLGGA
jgi:hypothetical protein